MAESTYRAGNLGLVPVKTASAAYEDERARRDPPVPRPPRRETTLASHIRAVFKENGDHRRTEGVDDALLDGLRRRLGEYSPEKLAALAKQGGSAVFAPITGVKCRNAEAWLSDVFSPDDEKSWALKPTPMPELPADAQAQVMQVAAAYAQSKVAEALQGGAELPPDAVARLQASVAPLLESFVERRMRAAAEKRVRAMERLMYDQLVEAEWDKVLDAFIFDLCTFKTAILKGPVIRWRRTRRWEIKADGSSELVVGREPRPVFERVSPFDFYPSPMATGAQGPGPVVEKLWLTRSSLEDLKDVEGYDAAAIGRILADENAGRSENPSDDKDSERLGIELRGNPDDAKASADTIFGLEFHGNVPGRLLLEHGLDRDSSGKRLRHAKEYCVEAILVGDELVYLDLNPDKMDRHPYSATSWSKVAGSFWGESVPELVAPVQDVCNASLRALVNNMGFASGPQAAVTDIDRIPEGEDLTEVYPFKLWQFTNERLSTVDPIKFFAIPSNAKELMAAYETFKRQADDDSGIPAYVYGNERTAGAGRTASGLSMLMTGASRGIKRVIRNAHRDVIRQCLMRLYDWNMQYSDDPKVKGDADVVAVGAVAVLTREQAATRRMELLQVMGSNPQDVQLFGLKARAELWRETLDTLEFDGDALVPTDEEVEEIERAAQAQAQQAQAAAQAAMQADVEAKMQELRIRQQEVELDYEVELRKLDQKEREVDLNALADTALREIGQAQPAAKGKTGGSK